MQIDRVDCPKCNASGIGEGRKIQRVGNFVVTFQNPCRLCQGAKSIDSELAARVAHGDSLRVQRDAAKLSIKQYAYGRGMLPSLWRAYENANIDNRQIEFQ